MQPIREIPHPQLPGTSVHVQKPRGAERIRLEQQRERETTIVTAVYELDAKTPIRKANGEVQTFIATAPLSVEAANATLKAYIVGMTNVPTHDGATLTFPVERAKETASERGKAIDDGLLFDDHLEVKLTGVAAAKLIRYRDPVEALQKRIDAAVDEADRATLQKQLAEINEPNVPLPYARFIELTVQQDGFFDSDPAGNV